MLGQMGFSAVPPSERWLVRVLILALICFTAIQASIPMLYTVANIGRWITMLLALILAYRWKKKNPYPAISNQGGFDILVWGLLFAYLLSALYSVAQNISFLYLQVCTLQVILFGLMIRHLSIESWRLLFGWLLILCVLVSVMGLRGSVVDPEKYLVQGRLAGLGNANSMGLIAMLGIVSALAKFMFADFQNLSRQKQKQLKLFYALGGVACLATLVLSGSRGSLGGLLTGVVVVTSFSRLSRYAPKLMVLLMLIPVLNWFVGSEIEQIISSVYVRGDDTDLLYSRRESWSLALEYFKESPWLGQGYALHDVTGLVVDGSGYLGLLASVGIIGTFLFACIALWILLGLFKWARIFGTRKKHYLPFNRELLALGGGSFSALLVQGIGEPWMLGPGSLMHVIYWVAAGACIAGFTYQQVPRYS